MSDTPLPIAVLASGSGTTLQNLVDRIADGSLDARIVQVIGSRDGLGVEQRALAAGLSYEVIDAKQYPEVVSFSRDLFERCAARGAQLICCAGWLRLLDIPVEWEGRIMNIHPSLLPSFGGHGMYGRRVHEAVLAHGCKVSGCTVHFVDNHYDNGPIILQRTCEVRDDDTPVSLAARVFEQERRAYPQAIELFRQGRLRLAGRRVSVGA